LTVWAYRFAQAWFRRGSQSCSACGYAYFGWARWWVLDAALMPMSPAPRWSSGMMMSNRQPSRASSSSESSPNAEANFS